MRSDGSAVTGNGDIVLTPEAKQAHRCETAFLSGVGANFEAAKGKQLRGTIWHRVQDDESDRLRAVMARRRMYDRELLKSLPCNRRIVLHGFDRRLVFGKKKTGVAIASTLSPLDHYVSEDSGDAPPIDLATLVDHVRALVGDARVPHIIGVCSPSGFADDARAARPVLPNVSLVLIEPDGKGGWLVGGGGGDVDARLLKLFDPEGASEKIRRVTAYIASHRTDLLTGAMSVSSVSSALGLPAAVVREGFERAAREDVELKLTRQDGAWLLFLGAPADLQEKKSMGVIDRIRQMFSSDGAEVEKINLLAERRAALAQRRSRIYEDIATLEKKEAELLAAGKAATSPVPRRRLAAQLAQLRKDIGRHNTTAGMLNQQINIISTDIHNLTLIQQGELAKLPDTEQLTENAVRAEELVETLKADAELVSSLETGVQENVTSEEELAILREFEGAEAVADAAAERETAGAEAPASEPAAAEPPSDREADGSQSADKEAS